MTQKEDSEINSISMKEERVPSSTPESDDKYKMVPPDGGWGWIIVLAASICTSLVQSPAAVFSLLYKDTMNDLQLTATNITVILNTYMGLLLIFGFFNSIPMKKFGYRATTIVGVVISSIGWFACTLASNFWHFFFVFGIMIGAGGAMIYMSTQVALGMYFTERRGRAMGLTMTVTGLSLIVAPPITSHLMRVFGARGTGLLQAALTLNGLVGAFLLHPVEWYMKKVRYCTEEQLQTSHGQDGGSRLSESKIKISEDKSYAPVRLEEAGEKSEIQLLELSENGKAQVENESNLGSKENARIRADVNINQARAVKTNHLEKEGALSRLIQLLDVHLLKDNTFLVLVVGISLAASAEYTFTFLVPLILVDFDFSLDETAYVMSLIATGDLLTRFLSPFFADWLKIDARSMYVLGLLTVVASRSVILFRTEFHAMMAVGLFLGMGKGVRTVYMNLVVPAYVPMDKLASALAFQNLGIGVITLLISPLIGMLRDVSGNYTPSVVVLNLATLLVIFVLVGDRAFARRKQRGIVKHAK